MNDQIPSVKIQGASTPYLLAPDNRLFVAAGQATLRWPESLRGVYPLAVLLAGLAIPFVGAIVVGVPLFLLLGLFVDEPFALFAGGDDSLSLTVELLLGFLPIFVLVWGWLRLFERRRFRTIGLDGGAAFVQYGRGLLVGLVMFGAAVAVMMLFGYMEVRAVNPGFAVWSGVLIIFAGWVVQGAAEEVLARGFLMPIIGARWHPLIGVILSSSIFGLLHLFNPNLSWLAMANLVLFGLFAALYALWEEGLWGVFAIHSVWNWAQGNLFGLPVSGQPFSSNTLLEMAETGPDALTGGAFGPEGGLVVTGVLAISALVVWLIARRPQEAARRPMPPTSSDITD
jgi:membrane protease YdiL (CAAX protease family)